MLTLLRLAGVVFFVFLAIAFMVTPFVVHLVYNRYGTRAKKTVRVTFVCFGFVFVTSSLAMALYDPASAKGDLMLALGGILVMAFFMGANLFLVGLQEKGPHRLFESLRRSLAELFRRHGQG